MITPAERQKMPSMLTKITRDFLGAGLRNKKTFSPTACQIKRSKPRTSDCAPAVKNRIIARVVDTRIALQIVSEAHPDLWLYRVTYSGFEPDDGRASGAKSSSSGSLSGSDSTRSGVSQSLSGRHTKRAF